VIQSSSGPLFGGFAEFCGHFAQKAFASTAEFPGETMTQGLLTAADINTLAKKRNQIMMVALVVGIAGIAVYLTGIGLLFDLFRNPGTHRHPRPEDGFSFLAFLPVHAILIGTLSWGERKVLRYAITCPNCHADITRVSQKIIATRCCHHCNQRIVEEGRTHGIAAFRRLARIQQRRFLIYWLWVWPIMAAVFFLLSQFDQTMLQNCPQILVAPGILGAVSAGWSFARTLDYRYFPQLIASAAVLVWGFRLIP
jgi:hypothetical protein